MNLILQAIKSLFRKLENRIPKTIADLLGNDKISGQVVEDMYYTEPDKLTDMVPEGQRAFTDQRDSWPYRDCTTYSHTISDLVYAKYPFFSDVSATIDSGMKFRVHWDGKEYNSACYDLSELFAIGNGRLYSSNRENTGEPFLILMNPYYDDSGLYIIASDNAEKHTVGLSTVVTGAVHQLHEKYLPKHSHSLAEIEPDDELLPIECIPVIPVENGGTGATNQYQARSRLGICYADSLTVSGTNLKVTLPDFSEYDTVGSLLIVRNSSELSVGAASFVYLKVNDKSYFVKKANGSDITNVPAGIVCFVKNGGTCYLWA